MRRASQSCRLPSASSHLSPHHPDTYSSFCPRCCPAPSPPEGLHHERCQAAACPRRDELSGLVARSCPPVASGGSRTARTPPISAELFPARVCERGPSLIGAIASAAANSGVLQHQDCISY